MRAAVSSQEQTINRTFTNIRNAVCNNGGSSAWSRQLFTSCYRLEGCTLSHKIKIITQCPLHRKLTPEEPSMWRRSGTGQLFETIPHEVVGLPKLLWISLWRNARYKDTANEGQAKWLRFYKSQLSWKHILETTSSDYECKYRPRDPQFWPKKSGEHKHREQRSIAGKRQVVDGKN